MGLQSTSASPQSRIGAAEISDEGHVPLSSFRLLERTGASVPAVADVEGEIQRALAGLSIPSERLHGRRIAVTAGSRGIANLREIVRAACHWIKSQGGQPFVIPAMGSHGGATPEGQHEILKHYGVTPEFVGAEVRSSMETALLGTTPEGFKVFMDRNAWEADAVLVMNRIKPHTDFSGNIESGLQKMMAVGMGKENGATQCHRWSWKFGFETAIRAIAGRVLASGKILCGLAVVENELHQTAVIRATLPAGLPAMEEETLKLARRLVARIPFPRLHLLIVDELGKNISGTGMDTKTIGRGVELQPGEAPVIDMIYVRDLTPETAGNAVGIGFADAIHERLYRKIDYQKMFVNARVSLNPVGARVPIYFPSDREALDVALGHLGAPEPETQRVVWIRNTLSLDRIAVSKILAHECEQLSGWRLLPEELSPQFDTAGNFSSPI